MNKDVEPTEQRLERAIQKGAPELNVQRIRKVERLTGGLSSQNFYVSADTDEGDVTPPAEVEAEAEPVAEEEPAVEEVKAEETPVEEEPAAETEQEEQQPARRQTAEERVRQSRQQVREARAERDQERQERIAFEEKMQGRLDALTEVRETPDREMDPDAYADHQKEIADSATRELADIKEQSAGEQENQRQANLVNEWLVDTISDFTDEHPDFAEAQQYVYDNEVSRLMEEQGASKEGAEQIVLNDLGQLATSYHEKGWNPCQFLYSQAQKRGFKSAPAAEEKQAESLNGNLKALDAGQNASKNTKGNSGNSQLTVEEVAAMSDEQFKKYASDDNLKKLFGG